MINLAKNHLPLFTPPVELPMRFRRPRGLFGIDRVRSPRTITKPSGPTFTYRPLQAHEGLDLYGDVGDPVFSARKGTVVQVSGSNPNDRWIAIRHVEPGGLAFATRYLHLQEPIVSIGDPVERGDCIGFMGSAVSPTHLHFEIHIIMNNTVSNDWHRINTELIDPLPILYPWEKVHFEQLENNTPSTQSSALLQEVGILRKQSIPMLQVRQNNKWYYIPLYDLDAGDQHLVDLLQKAYFHQKEVRLATRESPFFEGIEIITAARVV